MVVEGNKGKKDGYTSIAIKESIVIADCELRQVYFVKVPPSKDISIDPSTAVINVASQYTRKYTSIKINEQEDNDDLKIDVVIKVDLDPMLRNIVTHNLILLSQGKLNNMEILKLLFGLKVLFGNTDWRLVNMAYPQLIGYDKEEDEVE